MMSIAVLEDAMESVFLFFRDVGSCTIIFKIRILKSQSSLDRPNKNPSRCELRVANFLSGVNFLRLKKPFHMYLSK